MHFHDPLIPGRLERRYKRFLADVVLDTGERVTAHCPNTGSMLGCAEPGSAVWVSRADNPRRKYPYTWELVQVPPGVLVGINTARSNRLVREGMDAGVIAELRGYERVRPEVRYGEERSRIDFLLEADARAPCYVEVKNVTAAVEGGVAVFPDAVTARGTRHLRELRTIVLNGDRAMVLFCVQRGDVHEVRPADHIDPAYGRTLREALAAGVEAVAYRAELSPAGVRLHCPVPVVCP